MVVRNYDLYLGAAVAGLLPAARIAVIICRLPFPMGAREMAGPLTVGPVPCAASSWRPRHLPSAQHMGVRVADRLAAPRAGVEDHPVTAVSDIFLDRDPVGLGGYLIQQPLAGRSQGRKIRIVFPRDNQDMHGSLRIYIPERNGARTF
jgi:hypothetical protein